MLPFSPVSQNEEVLPIFECAFLLALLGLHFSLYYIFKLEHYSVSYMLGVMLAIAGVILVSNRYSLKDSFSNNFSEIVGWLGIGVLCFSAVALIIYFIKQWNEKYFIHYSISFALIILCDGVLRIIYASVTLLISQPLLPSFSSFLIYMAIGEPPSSHRLDLINRLTLVSDGLC